jgi:hypothetical protein
MVRGIVVASVALALVACGQEDIPPATRANVQGIWAIAAPTNTASVEAADCRGSRPGMGGDDGQDYDDFARTCRVAAVVVTQTGESFTMDDALIKCTEAGSTTEANGELTNGEGVVSGRQIEATVVFTLDDKPERLEFTGTVSGTSIALREIRRHDLPTEDGSPTGSCGWNPAVEYPVTITR